MTVHPESEARMVDVTGKEVTARRAEARGVVRMSAQTRDQIFSGRLSKGNAVEVARVAGIMAAKRTAELIPLCHPIAIGAIEVTLEPSDDGIEVIAEVKTNDRTGVEMEALTAVGVAALTLYDMAKGVEREIEITGIRLVAKSGGRSGDWHRA